MKKIITAHVATVLLVAAITNVHAQDVAINSSRLVATNAGTTENSEASVTAPAALSVSLKAKKDFAKTFTNAVKPNWSLSAEGGYTAIFTEAQVNNYVYYNQKGNWLGTIKRYNESKMPKELRQLVKPVYYDYQINGVAEIEVPGHNVTYLVYLGSGNSFKTLRIANGEMEVLESIKEGTLLSELNK